MKKSKPVILLLCGIVLGLAAFPVFAQKDKTKEVIINQRPLQDFGAMLKNGIETGEINLKWDFKIVSEGVLTEDGKYDQSKYFFVGEESVLDAVKAGILAISDSGWFGYLRNLGAEKVKITLMQERETFSAIIESEQKDETEAKKMTSAMNLLISLFKKNKTNLSEDEKTLFSGLQTTSSGKNFILSLVLPQQILHEIMLRNWAKAEDNKAAGE